MLIPLALTVTFGLQLLRVWMAGLLYYLYEVAGASPASMILLAVIVFAAAFFADVVQRRLGARAIAIVGSAVAVVRLVEQINTAPAFDLIVSSIGVALFLLFLPISFGALQANQHRRHFAASIVLGLSIDVAIKGAFGTLELSWVTGGLPLVIVVALIAIQLRLMWRQDFTTMSGGPARGLSLLALGPFFFLQFQMFQNIGFIATVTNFSLPMAFELTILANAIGLVAVSLIDGRLLRRAWAWTVALGLVLIVVTLPLQGDPLAALELIVGQIVCAAGLAIISEAAGSASQGQGAKTSLVVGSGMVLMFVMIVAYYIGHIVKLPIEHWTFAPIAAMIMTIAMVAAVRRFDGQRTMERMDWTAGFVGLGLMTLPVISLLTWHDPVAASGSLPMRVMSYNLHSGFDVTGKFALEEVAETVESEKANVIGLQEVSRGWLIDGSVDMLAWLSQRLDMPFVWGPTADPMWGNAILSKYPIKDVQLYAMPNNDVIRPMRGFIFATIDAGDRSVRVIITHLYHVGDDGGLRVPQVQALLDAWANQPATIIVGDLNARPDSIEMTMMRDAGLIDSFSESGSSSGLTFGSNHPDRRIDYIYHTLDLPAKDFHVNEGTASDHRAVAVTIDR